MIARARPRRPKYEWIRTLAVAQLPENAERVPADFWDRMEVAVGRMKPSQQKIYAMYRSGLTVAGIAALLECGKPSVYNRLGEIDRVLKTQFSGDNSYSKRVTPEIKKPRVLLPVKGH